MASGADLETQEPIAERIYGLISDAIIGGEIEAGASLTEPDLARRFGVSRAPLREALRRLEEQRLLERSPYRGMRVVEPSPSMLEELHEIREELEGLACRRAAERMVEADRARLETALVEERAWIRQRGQTKPAEAAAPSMLGLHSLVAAISGSRELTRVLDSAIWRLLRADYWRRLKLPEALGASHQEHVGIVRALAERDGELAALLMRRHIRNTLLRRT